jgi:twitching motility protein PilT
MSMRSLGTQTPQIEIGELLDLCLERGASDLHLTVGTSPILRVHGSLVRIEQFPELQPDELRRMIYAILTQKQRERLEDDLELDLSYNHPGKARFRVNVYIQREALGAAFRFIPFKIHTVEELGLPPIVAQIARLPRGMIIVTGPTGSGKSTTLAAMTDIINSERDCHIMTVEDPIEFLHYHKRAMVNQREVGTDTHGFAQALRHVLRQDPDVILVGEMRDLETIQTGLTAAETGHLVLCTLHTQDAPQTIDRIIDVFPTAQQQQVRVQLASTLQGVVTQTLVPTIDGAGRAVATEVMVATPAVRNLIREAKIHQIYSSMQAGAKFGMHTMDSSLADLVRKNVVSMQEAEDRAHDVEELYRLLGRTSGGGTHA